MRVVMVTGGSVGGLGFAIAEEVLARYPGVRVVITARSKDAAEDARRRLGDKGDVHAVLLELADARSVVQCANHVAQQHGTVHLLVNNAAALATAEGDDADAYMQHAHVDGPLLLTALLRPPNVLWVTSFTHRAAAAHGSPRCAANACRGLPWRCVLQP